MISEKERERTKKNTKMAEVLEKRETTPGGLHVPTFEKRIMRMRSPSPSFRARSQTPVRGDVRERRSMTPYQLFREKSAVPTEWRSITPFIQREEKEKTPFELGANIIQQLASYQAIIDKALVMDISLEEERPAKFILSEHSVIDRAAVMDLSNVEIIYVEDDDIDESDYRDSETPASDVDHAVSVYFNQMIKKRDKFASYKQKRNRRNAIDRFTFVIFEIGCFVLNSGKLFGAFLQ